MKERKVIKAMAETPAVVVDKTTQLVKKIPKQRPIVVAKKYWGSLGPGLTTGASDDDPSGIATYSQAGAIGQFRFLWLALYTIPFMIVAQEMCARIAQVTGRGISGIIKEHYPRNLLYLTVFLVFVANTINIGADLAAMAAAVRLLTVRFSFWQLAIFLAAFSLFLQISLPYAKYAHYLKIMAMVLLAYVMTAFLIQADWLTILKHTVLPTLAFDKNSLFMITAILGTTISPYLFYWQASQELEQQRQDYGRKTLSQLQGTNPKEIKAMRKDVASGMIFSNLIMFFIVAVTGSVLFSKGIAIKTAADAAAALQPLAGDYASLLFTIGIVGTGLLAIPVLAGSVSYAISEAFGFNQGLDKSLHRASAFYGVIIIAVLVGLGINFMGIDPIRALIGAAVVNGLVAPVLLTLILLVGNNQKVMGQWKNGPWSNTLGWLLTITMYACGIFTVLTYFLK